VPGKVRRELTAQEHTSIAENAQRYTSLSRSYAEKSGESS
jgi:carbonic anhydrase/acetyltransferase-like protein (isoleucine patch superfamily)